MTLGETVSLIALLSGWSGLLLGILNYLRDRHKIVVRLQWDLSIVPSDENPEKLWGLITIINAGRRATFVSHVELKVPGGHLIFLDSIAGKRLAEGDPPLSFQVDQDKLIPHAKNWRALIYGPTRRSTSLS